MRKLILALLVCIGCVITTYAQEFTDDEKQFVDDYVTTVNNMILDGKTGVSVEDAVKAMKLVRDSVPVSLKVPGKKVLSATEIYRQTKAATVVMGCAYLCTHCSHTHVAPASGYLIAADGIVITNYHVVAMYVDNVQAGNTPLGFFARLADGRTFPVKAILAVSERDDLAVLQLETTAHDLPALALADKAETGDEVFVVGHPKGMYYYFSRGVVTHKYIDKQSDRANGISRATMAISAEFAVGSSGGPVVNQYGNLVGTVSNTRTLNISPENPTVQMVVKNAIPVESLWKLVKKK